MFSAIMLLQSREALTVLESNMQHHCKLELSRDVSAEMQCHTCALVRWLCNAPSVSISRPAQKPCPLDMLLDTEHSLRTNDSVELTQFHRIC